MSPAPPVPDDEREIELRSLWTRLAARWWLPVAGLVLGAVVGVVVSVGGGQVYEARTLLYLGQPFTPNGGGQIQSLATNPKTVAQIVHSAEALDQAAAASGLTVGQLRGKVTSQAITSTATARTTSPLVEIVVTAATGAKAEKAATSLAASVTGQISEYVDRKIALLQQQIADDNDSLDATQDRIQNAIDQQKLAQNASGLTLAERLLIQSNANSSLNFYEARQTNLRADRNQADQLLSLAKNVEKSRVVQEARASRTTATSRRNAAVIGALAGLLLGVLAAYLADPLLAGRKTAA